MHDYMPGCKCDYCTTMDQILKQHRATMYTERERQAREFFYGADPFAPTEGQTRQQRKEEVFRNTYGGRKQNTYNVRWNSELNRHPGRYRRQYNQMSDMIEWQYKPWPQAEWVIYYKVSVEMIRREVASIGTKLAGKKFHTAASEALSKERYHKIERIDAPA